MKLLLDRKYKKSTYTIGRLFLNDEFFCNTMEDKDRGLKQTMSIGQIAGIKKKSVTAIPSGTYNIRMDIMSPKYSTKPWYVQNCNNARMPRLENVPGFEGILIHPGNTAADSEGCILVGVNDVQGMITKSKETFIRLYNKMYNAHKKGEKISITIR